MSEFFFIRVQSAGKVTAEIVLGQKGHIVHTVDFDLQYVSRGSGAVKLLEGKSFPIREGDLILFQPNEKFIVEEPTNVFDRQVFHFDVHTKAGVNAPPRPDSPVGFRLFSTGSDPEVRALAFKTISSFHGGDKTARDLGSVYLTELLLACTGLRLHKRTTLGSGNVEKNLPALKRVKDILDRRHLDKKREEVSVDQLARISGLSVNHLIRLFKSFTGKGPYEYFLYKKIEHAKQLLLESDMNVSEVARTAGFPGIHDFSHAFKKWTGMSPSTYSLRVRVVEDGQKK